MKKMRLLCAVGFLSLALNSSAQTEGTFIPDEKYKVSASVSLGGNLLAPEETPNVTCNLGKYGLEGWESNLSVTATIFLVRKIRRTQTVANPKAELFIG